MSCVEGVSFFYFLPFTPFNYLPIFPSPTLSLPIFSPPHSFPYNVFCGGCFLFSISFHLLLFILFLFFLLLFLLLLSLPSSFFSICFSLLLPYNLPLPIPPLISFRHSSHFLCNLLFASLFTRLLPSLLKSGIQEKSDLSGFKRQRTASVRCSSMGKTY